MAKSIDFGKKFAGGSVHRINDNIRVVANTYFTPGHAGWWNPERDKKLLYIMDEYNDSYRAARVLVCPRWNIMQRLRHLEDEFKKAEKAYEDYINNGGTPFINEDII